ncbi:MAG TPA: ATP-binding protein [Bacteroidales bacterium]|nr:MAG: C4-dicarboxylate transport sensor protein DctB [Bacteroidetes bacterium ADurb.Bin041]HNV51095.1 ATP-binding protein [Bacteroidales bacterium]HNY59666.1 ATP-binding protein [Bacteroidales bacterium]
MHLRILYLRLAIYILLLIVFSGLLFLSVQALNWYAVLCIIGIIWVIYRIIRLFNRNPQKLSYFLNAIENQDSTLFFSEKIRHKPTKELHGSLNRMNQLIQEVKLKNREQEQYYSLLLEQVATGIVVMNDSGNILLANSAARSLLNYSFLNHIEQLKRVDIKLYNAFLSLQQDNQNQFVKVRNENGIRQLSLQVTSFKRHDNALRIVSVHDISNELDAKEIESWQKLIRVLTHEIMNSIAPITSLSETLLNYYKLNDEATVKTASVDDQKIANTVKGLEVINERGTGLIQFVESYRRLTGLSKPIRKPLVVKELIEHLLLLLENEPNFQLIQKHIEISSTDLVVEADITQLSQALINLIKNAIQAVEKEENPVITIMASRSSSGYIEITVQDNGPGIPTEIVDQIFIPFFTTKERGTGIGLSLTRQIMKNHGGSIEVFSLPNNTRFVLKFFQ